MTAVFGSAPGSQTHRVMLVVAHFIDGFLPGPMPWRSRRRRSTRAPEPAILDG